VFTATHTRGTLCSNLTPQACLLLSCTLDQQLCRYLLFPWPAFSIFAKTFLPSSLVAP